MDNVFTKMLMGIALTVLGTVSFADGHACDKCACDPEQSPVVEIEVKGAKDVVDDQELNEQHFSVANEELTDEEEELLAANEELADEEEELLAANEELADEEEELLAANEELADEEEKLLA